MWADLMRKVFACDVLICPHCESKSSAVASISDHQIDVLECLIDYDSRAPPKWLERGAVGSWLYPKCFICQHLVVVYRGELREIFLGLGAYFFLFY